MNHIEKFTNAAFQDSPGAYRRGAVTFTSLLLVGGGFAGAHILQYFGILASPQWRISTDRGYAEVFEYTLFLFAAINFLILFKNQHAPLFAAIAAVLVYLIADNAFQLHEQAGKLYEKAGWNSPVQALGADHAGEFFFFVIVGGVLLSILVGFILHAAPRHRKAGLIVIGLLASIGLCSALVDTIYQLTKLPILGFIEDGGELFFTILIASYSAFLADKG